MYGDIVGKLEGVNLERAQRLSQDCAALEAHCVFLAREIGRLNAEMFTCIATALKLDLSNNTYRFNAKSGEVMHIKSLENSTD